jgi:hypothetical protein
MHTRRASNGSARPLKCGGMRQCRPDRETTVSFRFSLFVCGVGLAALWPSVVMTQQALPDAIVQNLVATAQENFWGRAVLSSGETVQPIDDAERIAPVIPFSDSVRVVSAAAPVGGALWCGVEWQPYYLAFMQSERRKSWSEKQVAFIGALFGLAQNSMWNALKQNPCAPETREVVLRRMGGATGSLEGANGAP